MLKIRLRRMGARNQPYYRIVVSDSRQTAARRGARGARLLPPAARARRRVDRPGARALLDRPGRRRLADGRARFSPGRSLAAAAAR